MPTFTTAQLRRSCWLAIFAMLALALLPSVSHALSAGRGAGDIEVCTPQGVRFVSDAGTGSGPTAPLALDIHLEHCPFCSLSAHALGMPPAPLSALPLALTTANPPPRFLQAPRTPFAWRSAQPRGPPSLS